jgi:hypothetical protein
MGVGQRQGCLSTAAVLWKVELVIFQRKVEEPCIFRLLHLMLYVIWLYCPGNPKNYCLGHRRNDE